MDEIELCHQIQLLLLAVVQPSSLAWRRPLGVTKAGVPTDTRPTETANRGGTGPLSHISIYPMVFQVLMQARNTALLVFRCYTGACSLYILCKDPLC